MFAQYARHRSSTVERFQKLNLKEELAEFDWVLKSHLRYEFHTNFKFQEATSEELQLLLQTQISSSICHCLQNGSIQSKQIIVNQGKMIVDNKYTILLENCFVHKKKVNQSCNAAFFVVIKGSDGQFVLIYNHPQSVKEMFKLLKKFAKQSQFLNKYRVRIQSFSNFYQIQRKKSRKSFLAQVFNKQCIVCQEQVEILENYIRILRSGQITNYMPITAVFEDKDMLCIVTDQFNGITFEYMTKQITQFNQLEFAEITHQIIQGLKSLNDEEIFHGNVCPQNIIMTTLQRKSSILLINSNYKSYENGDIEYYLQSINSYMIAPEILDKRKAPSIQSDLFQLGVTLAIATFFPHLISANEEIIKCALHNLPPLIQGQENLFQKQLQSTYHNLHCYSQLDLIKKLLNPNPDKRIQLFDALNHHWFVNIKDKAKQNQQVLCRKRGKKLPSLRTIIEIREQQSELEIKNRLIDRLNSQQNSNLSLNKKKSIQILAEMTPFMSIDEGLNQLNQFGSSIDIVEEDHQLCSMIGKLNNPEFDMRPSPQSRGRQYLQQDDLQDY